MEFSTFQGIFNRGISEVELSSAEREISVEFSTWNFQRGIFNVEFSTWNFQRGIFNMELSTWNFPHGIFNVETLQHCNMEPHVEH
jgi:hypothetical protein